MLSPAMVQRPHAATSAAQQPLVGLKQELLDPAEHDANSSNLNPHHPMLFSGQTHGSANNFGLPHSSHRPQMDDHLMPPSDPPPPPQQPSSSSASGQLSCTVCGDVATGRHYGSVACNGCKGFFRRTIRRGYNYTCRFNSNCQIDKHNRAVCRACRYTRCIQFGMKVDAVQSERDLIGKRARSFSNSTSTGLTMSPQESSALGTTAEEEEVEGGGGGRRTEPAEQKQHNIEQRQMDSFDSASAVPQSPCSSATASVPSHFMAQQQHQPQFSSVDSDEPVPRKRSFSSGSKSNFQSAAGGKPPFQPSSADQQPPAAQTEAPPQQQQQQLQEDPNLAEPWSAQNGNNGRALLRHLLCSEEKIRNMRDAVIAQTCNLEYARVDISQIPMSGANGTRNANENDILQSLHSQLLLVIEWAKTLKPFAELPTDDQTALLKNFAAQHVVLCVAYRSTSDFLKLINDSCIPRIANGDDKDLFYRKDAERVMDLLVSPMRFLRIDDVEFVALKACILFNPVARGLSPPSVMSVLQTRRQIFRALHHYVRAKMPPDEDRIGDLTFFILSPLQSLAKAVSEDVLVSKLSGVARLDQLMEELILEDNDPKEPDTPHGADDVASSSAVDPNVVGQQQQQYQHQQRQQQFEMDPHNHHQQQQQQQVSGAQIYISSFGGGGWAPPPPPHIPSAVQQQQRGRRPSSSASSSSNSPPLGAGQPPPAFSSAPSQSTTAPAGGGLSTINEALISSSSALSSYVFGGSLKGGSSASHHPPPHPHHHPHHHPHQHHPPPHPHHHPHPPQHQFLRKTLPSSSSSSTAPSSAHSHHHHPTPMAASSAGSPATISHPISPQFRHHHPPGRSTPITSASASQEYGAGADLWAQQIGVYSGTTPCTPGPAIYSGTSPSPPQRFGIGGGGPGMRTDQQ